MFKNLKVGKKLSFSFGAIMIFYIFTVIVAFVGFRYLSDGLDKFYNVPYPSVKAALAAQASTNRIQLDIYRSYEVDDAKEIQVILKDVDTQTEVLYSTLDNLADSWKGDPALLQAVEDTGAKTTAPREEAMQYINLQDDRRTLAVLEGDYKEACDNFNAALQKIINESDNSAQLYYDSGMGAAKTLTIFLSIITVVLLFLTVLIAIRITRGLVSPIQEMEHAIAEMAYGRMDSVVTYTSKDELGSLAENLRFVLSTLSEYIQHICSRLGSLASGDFTVEMDMDYRGEFASIKDSGNQIIDALNDTLSQIQQSSDQVAYGSDQVSSGAQALSQGASEQASSVQELATTLNDLSEQVKQTAENSSEVNALIDETGRNVNDSNHKMETMMLAMKKINESSGKIEKIIKTIEDIAFQTNILALNAAVEAARAGTAGKGFAVVADEVRSLASKSAEAAKNTTELISHSLSAVEEGNQIAGETQSSLLSIVEKTQQITDGMSKITDAANMQSMGISQVTTGVDQVSSVVQTNAATAEESAATSEELSSQASLLKTLVGRFKLKNN